MRVAIITEDQTAQLRGAQFAPDAYFNPIKDANSNYVISEQEVLECVNPEFQWVRELALTEYQKPTENYL